MRLRKKQQLLLGASPVDLAIRHPEHVGGRIGGGPEPGVGDREKEIGGSTVRDNH
jgi:hypothetical protein